MSIVDSFDVLGMDCDESILKILKFNIGLSLYDVDFLFKQSDFLKQFLIFQFYILDSKLRIFQQFKLLFLTLFQLQFNPLTIESQLLFNLNN